MPKSSFSIPSFLTDLLAARSPSGDESESQAVFDQWVKPRADAYQTDALGNRMGQLNSNGDPVVMLAGHLDELGFIITYVSDDGFLYFDTLGGHDKSIISGRRVLIRTAQGIVKGVTGKRAVHLMDTADRKKVPEIHQLWIDIGASSKQEALARVKIGDTATYDYGFEIIKGTVATARAFDNKVGAYIAGETLIRLAKAKTRPVAQINAVGTAQEEVGVRGATTAAFALNPHVAIAIDVGHATDHPDCDQRKFGEFTLGGGPIICRGPNINPLVYQALVKAANQAKVAFQLEADPRPTGTDARAIQVTRGGVATGLISVPLRYMHTPSEMVDLKDVEATIKILMAFSRALKKGERMHW